MSDFDTFPPSSSSLPPSSPKAETGVDPRLLERALKKMKGLVNGNGLSADEVKLSEEDGAVSIVLYRFRAQTSLKLVTEHGIKIEPGKNTRAEAVQTEQDLKQRIARIPVDVQTDAAKRKQIVDFIGARPDKGFGIGEQRMRFHQLSQDLVLHERCQPCGNTGRSPCVKCRGRGNTQCVKCDGRRFAPCLRCQGSGQMQVGGKSSPCTTCRGDGKVSCPKCRGQGYIKCQPCAATGTIQCRPCAGSGWVSHLAHIELFAQITFEFDRETLPPPAVGLLRRNASEAVVKNHVEVAMKEGWEPDIQARKSQVLSSSQRPVEEEPEGVIRLHYEALCPYGGITFRLGEKTVSGNLFGFRAQLHDTPPFLDHLTKIGQQALFEAAEGKGDIVAKLGRAAKFALLADVMTQTLRLKTPKKAAGFLAAKYTAGLPPERFGELVLATDATLKHITRRARLVGLAVGESLFTLAWFGFFAAGGQAAFHKLFFAVGLPPVGLWILPLLAAAAGGAGSLFCSKIVAKKSQVQALTGIIPPEILNQSLPPGGKTTRWAYGIAAVSAFAIAFFAPMLGFGG